MTTQHAIPCIDIGVNLTDRMYQGEYNGKKAHESDIPSVLQRSWEAGVRAMILTAGSRAEAQAALELSQQHQHLYSTVGVHPTRCQEFEDGSDPQRYMDDLVSLAKKGKGKVVAIGECGLDYDRLQFCPKDIQQRYFEEQFKLAECTQLPMFLHHRVPERDFVEIIRRNRHRFTTGVVHSFTGTEEEAAELIDLDLFIGINGCSLKKPENLAVIRSLPSHRILLETDAPWCEIRPTHAGFSFVKTTFPFKKKERFEMGTMVKGRNEPCSMRQVLEVVAGTRGEDVSTLADQIFRTTCKVFFPEGLY